MIKVLNKKTPATVLGLALERDRLQGVLLRRSNGSLIVVRSFSAPLALNPLTGDPELIGREIRNHLEQAGVRERRCVVSLPLSSALFLLTEIPEMPEEDVASFLEIELERGFPHGQESLYTSTLRFHSADGKKYAGTAGVSRNDVSQLDRALRAAQLRPVGLSLGLPALQNPRKPEPVLALAVDENTVELQISANGGIVTLRSLDEVFESEGAQKVLSTESLSREIRITRGQLPPEFRDSIREVRVFGHGEIARRFIADAAPRLEAMSIRSTLVDRYEPGEFPKKLPPDAAVSAALSLAAGYLTGSRPAFEFLPPKVRPWRQLTARFSSRKLAWAAAAAACRL